MGGRGWGVGTGAAGFAPAPFASAPGCSPEPGPQLGAGSPPALSALVSPAASAHVLGRWGAETDPGSGCGRGPRRGEPGRRIRTQRLALRYRQFNKLQQWLQRAAREPSAKHSGLRSPTLRFCLCRARSGDGEPPGGEGRNPRRVLPRDLHGQGRRYTKSDFIC